MRALYAAIAARRRERELDALAASGVATRSMRPMSGPLNPLCDPCGRPCRGCAYCTPQPAEETNP